MRGFAFIFSLGILTATSFSPIESVEGINNLLTLKKLQSVSLISPLNEPVTIQFELKTTAKAGVTLHASENTPIWCENTLYIKPFAISQNTEVTIHDTQVIPPSGELTLQFLRRILNVTPPLYCRAYFDEKEDVEGVPLHVDFVLQREPTFLLSFDPFSFNTFDHLNIDHAPYLTFFKEHVTEETFQQYTEGLQSNYDQLVERQQQIDFSKPHKIPLNVFIIWITDPINPQGIGDKCLEYIHQTKKILREEDGWQYYVYVNQLEDICNVGLNIPHHALFPLFLEAPYKSVFKAYQQALSEKNYGKASDIARCVLLHKFGGLYQDTDVAFKQSPKQLHHLCNFYAGIEYAKAKVVGNAIIASTPNHPILEEYLHLIGNERTPLHLPEGLNNFIHQTLYETGPFCLTKAIMNKMSEHDVILPPHVFYHPLQKEDKKKQANNDTQSLPLSTQASHYTKRTWIN
jgi:hypothetical protein